MGIFKKTVKYSKASKDLDKKIKNLDEGLKKTGVIPEQNDAETFFVEEKEEKNIPKIADKIEVVKEEEQLYNWRETLLEETVEEKVEDIQETHTLTRVENYISESNKELIVLRDQVLQEISEETLLNLPEIKTKISKVLEIYEQLQEGLLNEPPEVKNEDPLTPLDQKFVTPEDLNKHYTLFINRIQEQLATLGGGGETKLKYLDDIVGIATNASAYDGKFLSYDHSVGKFKFKTVSGGGSALTVSKRPGISGIDTNQVSNVTALRFDSNSGFNVTDLGSGEVFVDLGSTFNPWYINGQDTLKATGEEPIEFIAGPGIAITTKAVASVGIGTTFSKAITITATGGGSSSQWVTTSAGIHTLSNVGIGTTNPTSALHVFGDVNISGVVTATSFSGNATSATYATNAGVSTYAQTAGISTYSLIAGIATYATNAGIATYATTSGIATYSSTSGIATYATYAQTAGIATSAGTATTSTYLANAANILTGTIAAERLSSSNSFDVYGNLYVQGNVSIGGTTISLVTQELKIKDNDIVVGFTTDAFGNDASNDTTANHGGVAVASTEGTPLVQFSAGIETTPHTYKKIMWFKANSWSGLGTDAWLFNYGVGIGSTQVPNGVRLAAGNVKITEFDLSTVRHINASGIVTGSSFRPSSGYYQSANGTNAFYVFDTSGDVSFQGKIVTNYIRSNTNLNPTITVSDLDLQFARNVLTSGITTSTGGFVGNLTGTATTATYSSTSGTATYATTAGIATYSSTSGIATYATTAGIATYSSTAGIATYATSAGVSTSATTAGYATTAGISTVSQGLTGTPNISVGIVTATSYNGSGINLTGIVTSITAGSGISINQSTGNVTITATGGGGGSQTLDQTLALGNSSTLGMSVGVVTATTLNVTGIATIGTGIVTTLRGTNINYTGISTFTSTFITNVNVSGVATIGTGIVTTLRGTTLNYTGVSTFSSGPVLISSTGTATTTGTASQPLQVTGGAYVSGSVGIGTTNPREKVDVLGGNIGIQGVGSTSRFYIQHNTAQNSLDFVFV